MKRLTRNLRDSSIEAFILALETINRPTIRYRMEAFCILFCNAWELLIKAKLLNDGSKIFYPKKRKQPRKSLSIDDCLKRAFTKENDPVRLNIERIHELRNNAIHLVIPFIPRHIMGLFQAGVTNYPKALLNWFGIYISDRIPLGMMVLVYDFDPVQHSLEHAKMKRRISTETYRWLVEFQNGIQGQASSLGDDQLEFCIPITFRAAITKKPDVADIVLGTGTRGKEEAIIIEKPRSPDITHPYRATEVVEEVCKRLKNDKAINIYDIICVKRVYNVESKSEFYYKDKFSPKRYSNGFVEWIVKQATRDSSFIVRTRDKAKRLK